MKKFLLCLLVFTLVFSLFGCDWIEEFIKKSTHNHTYEYVYGGLMHFKQYTCGCSSDGIVDEHYDNDGNGKCDACDCFMKNDESVVAAYYLPYTQLYTPISLTFFENGKCIFEYYENHKEPYIQNYWIEDDRVYLDIETGPKVHVFDIFEKALVFNSELSTANLWDTEAYRGPVIYFVSDASEAEILSTYVMAKRGADAPPKIEKIYGKYEREVLYEYNTKSYTYYTYVILVAGDEGASAWSEKIIGTDYTFTYPNNAEILIVTQGRVININNALDKKYVTLEEISGLYKMHSDCSIAHSYDEGVVTQIDGEEIILYTCFSCGDTKTVSLPNDFSFSLTWGFDGEYDSTTGHLVTGYNYDLNKKCETTLLFDHDELMNIYRILYNGGLFEIKESFRASDQLVSPSYSIYISYSVGGEAVSFSIGGASYLSYTEWEVHSDLCYAYNKVISEFIKSSEEYKALPPNQKVYY